MELLCAHATAADGPIDLQDLLQRCLGRVDLVERILLKFQGALQCDLKALETALDAEDADAVAHIAHRLKGASLSVAAHGLKEHAQRIEASASRQRLEEMQVYVAQLKEACTQFDNLLPIIAMAGQFPTTTLRDKQG